MDTFSEPLTDSATTGLPSLEPRDESSTGPRLGATGSARTRRTFATLEEAIRVRGAEERAERRRLIESKPWHAVSIERLLTGMGKPPAILIDDRNMRSYDPPWLPPSLSAQQCRELAELLPAARRALEPAGAKAVAVILLKLADVVIVPDARNPDGVMAAYVEDLEHVPADVLEQVCREWRQTERFWPTIAELLERCRSLVSRRRSLLHRLASIDSVRCNPAPGCIVTAAWHDAREAHGRSVRDALNPSASRPLLTDGG